MRPVAFGRSSASSTRPLDVRIHHSEVSRRHCEVGLDPTGAWIVDRSSNGTYLNGERIPRAVEVRLQHGDR
jgi:pSer/pThr/pTyr-binding forkhead associated (FHA) protein